MDKPSPPSDGWWATFFWICLLTSGFVAVGSVIWLLATFVDNAWRWLSTEPLRFAIPGVAIFLVVATNVLYVYDRKKYKRDLKRWESQHERR